MYVSVCSGPTTWTGAKVIDCPLDNGSMPGQSAICLALVGHTRSSRSLSLLISPLSHLPFLSLTHPLFLSYLPFLFLSLYLSNTLTPHLSIYLIIYLSPSVLPSFTLFYCVSTNLSFSYRFPTYFIVMISTLFPVDLIFYSCSIFLCPSRPFLCLS